MPARAETMAQAVKGTRNGYLRERNMIKGNRSCRAAGRGNIAACPPTMGTLGKGVLVTREAGQPVNQTPMLGERIREVRKRRGLSQRELAGLSGVSVSLIRKLEQSERQDARLETLRKIAAALRVPTTMLLPGQEQPEAAYPQTDLDWEPVRRALVGMTPAPPPEPPTTAGVRGALHALAPALASHSYSAVKDALPALLRDADELPAGPEARQIRASILNTTGYLLTQTRQFGTAELTLSRAIDAAGDNRLDAAAAADTMLWLYLRQGRLAEARAFAARWADEIEPRFSRATVLELILWGRFLLNITNAAVRDNCPGEAEDALDLAAAAAARIGREVRRHDNSQCVFGPVTVAYIRAESHVLWGQPDLCLSIAGSLPVQPPFPRLVSRLRHQLDIASAKTMLRSYGDAFTILQQLRHDVPEWLTQQRYARDILASIISHRRTLTPDMRELADFMHLAL
jgi:DNA-binding XRE family transcriptional regulator